MKPIHFFYPLLILCTYSCSNSADVKMISNEGIVFRSEITEAINFREYNSIKCVVKNTTNKDVFFIEQSCNGLDYFLTFKPDDYVATPLLNCNASWPVISQLRAGDSLRFQTAFASFDSTSGPLEKIGLDFRVVDKYYTHEELLASPELVKKVYSSPVKARNIIWDQKK